MESLSITLTWQDWLHLFIHYLTLSLLAVGGAITTAPDMHRFLVDQQHWLTDSQFNASIAIAQAAPGPNVLFIALMGFNVGLNAGGIGTALWGVLLSMTGIMLPCSLLTFFAARWGRANSARRSVRAFKQGMVPIVIALLIATGWLLGSTHPNPATDWPLWLTTLAATVLVWRTKLHLLWLLGTGAALGALGWI